MNMTPSFSKNETKRVMCEYDLCIRICIVWMCAEVCIIVGRVYVTISPIFVRRMQSDDDAQRHRAQPTLHRSRAHHVRLLSLICVLMAMCVSMCALTCINIFTPSILVLPRASSPMGKKSKGSKININIPQ